MSPDLPDMATTSSPWFSGCCRESHYECANIHPDDAHRRTSERMRTFVEPELVVQASRAVVKVRLIVCTGKNLCLAVLTKTTSMAGVQAPHVTKDHRPISCGIKHRRMHAQISMCRRLRCTS